MMSLSARTTHECLIRICFTDYAREMALVADRRDPATGEHAVLAVGRLAGCTAATRRSSRCW